MSPYNLPILNEPKANSPPLPTACKDSPCSQTKTNGEDQSVSEESPSFEVIAGDEAENSNKPPDGGYGWVCVLSCAMLNCFTWGVISSYGVYLSQYLAHNQFPGATSIDYAFIGGINFSAAMVTSPLITFITRKYGKHTTMSLGIVFQSAGFITASFCNRIWQLYLSQGLLVGLGTGFLYIPSVAILPQWFDRKRSLANGISSAGSGIGGAIFSWSTGAMIDSLSVAWALRITGIIVFVTNSIATLLLRDRNKHIQPTQLGFDLKLLRRYDVWLVLLWGFISMLGYITLLYSLSDFARSIGLTDKQATDVVGLLNIGTAIGRPATGIWSDKYNRIDVAAILTLVCGLCCFAFWLPATSYALTVVFAIISGAILGVFWVTVAPICVEVVGLKDLPSLLSISWVIVAFPTTFSEVIALKLVRPDRKDPYLFAQIYAGLAYVFASLLLFELRRVKRKRSTGQARE